MKPLFKNITIYNSKMFNEFVEFHDQKFGFSYNAYNLIMILLLFYCILLTVINKQFPLLLLFMAMLIVLILFRIYLPIRRNQDDQKKYSQNKQSQFSFDFYKHYFKIEKTVYFYYRLYKVFETKDYFYLYVTEQNAILVSKTGFKVGTSEEFSNFIKKKCLLKYSKQKEKKSQ